MQLAKGMLVLAAVFGFVLCLGGCTAISGGGGGDNGTDNGNGDEAAQGDRVGGLVAEIEMTAEELAKFEEDNAECLACHDNPAMGNPRISEMRQTHRPRGAQEAAGREDHPVELVLQGERT